MLLRLRLCVFIIKDKTFDCENQNHTLNIITGTHNQNLQATL